MNTAARGFAAALLLCALARPVSAQFETPAVDATISAGEYAHSSDGWSMT